MDCPEGQIFDNGKCYEPCPEGSIGMGEFCLENCPEGFTDSGITCIKADIQRDSSLPIQPVEPLQSFGFLSQSSQPNETPKPNNNMWWIWIIVGIVVILLIVGVVIFIFTRRKTHVPPTVTEVQGQSSRKSI
jgi:ATP-dependent Zn protease